MKGSTSELLRDNCDEFIYYEDLERQEQDDQQMVTNLDAALPERKREVFALLIEACNALRRENHEVLYASMIKDTMKRKKPSFDESYYGYRSFTHLLEDADNSGLVDIERNPKSGTYVVTGFGERESPKSPTDGARRRPPASGPPAPSACLRPGARMAPRPRHAVREHGIPRLSPLGPLHSESPAPSPQETRPMAQDIEPRGPLADRPDRPRKPSLFDHPSPEPVRFPWFRNLLLTAVVSLLFGALGAWAYQTYLPKHFPQYVAMLGAPSSDIQALQARVDALSARVDQAHGPATALAESPDAARPSTERHSARYTPGGPPDEGTAPASSSREEPKDGSPAAEPKPKDKTSKARPKDEAANRSRRPRSPGRRPTSTSPARPSGRGPSCSRRAGSPRRARPSASSRRPIPTMRGSGISPRWPTASPPGNGGARPSDW
jgi:hypothetical protein